MYSVHDYGRMAADGVRMDAYARALARAVKPGSIVVDLGAGTGIASILAARFGAKRVHAIDPNPAIHLLPDLARENGVAERIVVHHARSVEVDIPERADVIVSDLRGLTPLNGEHLPAIRDARERLLRPGGLMIPASDALFVAVVQADDMWRWLARAWESFEERGVRASAARSSILNTIYSDHLAPLRASDVLSSRATWGTLDYSTHAASVVEGAVDIDIRREGTAHGLVVWFEATLLDEISFTTAPGHSLAYTRVFLPFSEPVRVTHGAKARITLRADVRGERWAWDTELGEGSNARRFRHSTFFGMPTDAATLLRESTTHRPRRSPSGERLRQLLDAMNGERTVAELVDHVSASLPADSPARGVISDEIRNAVSTYGR